MSVDHDVQRGGGVQERHEKKDADGDGDTLVRFQARQCRRLLARALLTRGCSGSGLLWQRTRWSGQAGLLRQHWSRGRGRAGQLP